MLRSLKGQGAVLKLTAALAEIAPPPPPLPPPTQQKGAALAAVVALAADVAAVGCQSLEPSPSSSPAVSSAAAISMNMQESNSQSMYDPPTGERFVECEGGHVTQRSSDGGVRARHW